jgi:hypothetical protein
MKSADRSLKAKILFADIAKDYPHAMELNLLVIGYTKCWQVDALRNPGIQESIYPS